MDLTNLPKPPKSAGAIRGFRGGKSVATSGKIELPNKLGAIQLLAKMCGWLGPEEHEHGASNELVEVTQAAQGWRMIQRSEGLQLASEGWFTLGDRELETFDSLDCNGFRFPGPPASRPAYIYLHKGTKGATASQTNKKNRPTPNKIIIAGTAATANLTIKPTMLKNGMSTSTTVTFAGRSSFTTFAAARWTA
jgi:hypothetical protein